MNNTSRAQEGKPARPYISDVLESFFKLSSEIDQIKTNRSMLLAAKIDERLKALDLKKGQFALAMKVPPSVVTKWLKGNHNFTINTLTEIEDVLKIKLINV